MDLGESFLFVVSNRDFALAESAAGVGTCELSSLLYEISWVLVVSERSLNLRLPSDTG